MDSAEKVTYAFENGKAAGFAGSGIGFAVEHNHVLFPGQCPRVRGWYVFCPRPVQAGDVPFRPTEMRNGKLLTTSKGVRAMLLSRSVQHERKGALAPLLALLIIPILGMIAFSVDLGYLIATRTELQNAADAAAMAGAQ